MQFSEYFDNHEFTCVCGCGRNNINPELIALLDLIRKTVNRPITILSGCRCANLNAVIGGAKNSQHVLGNAADINVRGMSAAHVYTVINAIQRSGVHVGGFSIYSSFVHVDVSHDRLQCCN